MNATTVQTMTLRDHIAEALAEKQQKDAEQFAKSRESNRARLTQRLDSVLGVKYAGEFDQEQVPTVEVEGFRFTLYGDYKTDLAVVRVCPDCKQEVLCGVTSYLSLAEDKDLGYPHGKGYCLKQQEAVAQTTEERFLQAVREFIAENSYQGG